MFPLRTVTDIVGSTVASTAQLCAREILKRCDQVRTSRTVGQFVVDSGVAALRSRLAGTAPSPAPDTSSAPQGASPPADSASGTSASTPSASGTSASTPVADYDLLTSAQVVELIDTLDPGTVRAVLDYEMDHRRRRLVVEAAQRHLAT